MEVLKGFNSKALYNKLLLSEEEFPDWLKDMGLLHQKRTFECGAVYIRSCICDLSTVRAGAKRRPTQATKQSRGSRSELRGSRERPE